MKRLFDAKVSQWVGNGIPLRLHLRTDLHLVRKIWHMTMGLTIAFIYLAGVSRTTGVVILGLLLAIDLFVETARLRIPSLNDRVLAFLGPIMRTNEVDRLSAIPHYLSSTILGIAIFPKPIAILSILYLACGDPIASLFGVLYGKRGARFNNGKSLIGTLAGVVTCALITFVFLKVQMIPNDVLLPLVLVGGVAGGTAELLPLEVDDNFTIPLVSGFVMWLAFILLGV